jgi:hypothetical protein
MLFKEIRIVFEKNFKDKSCERYTESHTNPTPLSYAIAPLFSRSRTKYFILFFSLFCVTYSILVNENAIIVETYVKFKTNGSADFRHSSWCP